MTRHGREIRSATVVIIALIGVFTLFALKPWRAGIQVVVNDPVDEAIAVVSTGNWEGRDGYNVRGAVELTDSTVRFVRFSAEPTPNAHVFLRAGDDTVDIGRLRGTDGQLVYRLPAGSMPSAYDAVEIEDRTLGRAIAQAPLVRADVP